MSLGFILNNVSVNTPNRDSYLRQREENQQHYQHQFNNNHFSSKYDEGMYEDGLIETAHYPTPDSSMIDGHLLVVGIPE